MSIPAEMQLDLGAMGKGVALDEILKILEAHPEVSGAVISVGGSILLIALFSGIPFCRRRMFGIKG